MHKKNKFLIVCVSLCAAMLLFSATFVFTGRANFLHQVGAAIVYPFEWFFSTVENAVSGSMDYFSSMDELLEENKKLKEENAALRGELADAELIRDENSRLYAYLSMKELYRDFQMCEAPIVSVRTSVGDSVVELTIGEGSSSGIAVNMPVITEVGLVGYVTEVGNEWCRVRTVVNTSTVVSATASNKGYSGMICGEFSVIDKGYFKLIEIDTNADVQVGDMIVTRGDGSVYPYGIPIGKVISIEKNALSRTTEAVIEPFSDFTFIKTSHVMILTGYSTHPKYIQSDNAE